jgi:hypothetical protein
LTIEERPWAAGEIAEQIQGLSNAAGVDWREELALVIQPLKETEDKHAKPPAPPMCELLGTSRHCRFLNWFALPDLGG